MAVNHQNNYSSTLSQSAAQGATSSFITTPPSVSAPFYLIYDALDANGVYETVYVTAKSGSEMTHAALSNPHESGETVIMSFDVTEYEAMRTAITAAETANAQAKPVGEIMMFGGSSVPTGYLECDGSAVSRTTYADLFAVISTLFGVGDGSTTFNVPNFKGRVAVGYNSSDADFNAVGDTGGANTINIEHTHTESHTHSMSGTIPATGSHVWGDLGTGAEYSAQSGHTHTFSGTSGAGSASGTSSSLSATQSVLNPYIALKFIIRA